MGSRSRKKQLYRMEIEDAEGISRKKWNHTISLELFVILKLSCIIAIPIVYFVYSPLLVVVMAAYVTLFYLAIMAERRINTSVIKKNHIKIPKLDSAVALIVIVVALFGVFTSGTQKVKMPEFDDLPQSGNFQKFDFGDMKSKMRWREVTRSLKNFGSLLTGERSVFGNPVSKFGMREPPADFPTDMGDLPEMPSGGGMPPRPNFEFSVDDLPIEYMFSSIISTVNSVLIFSVSGLGAISLIALYFKRKKFNAVMNEVLVVGENALTDEEIDRILDFGVVVQSFSENDDDYDEQTQNNEQISHVIIPKSASGGAIDEKKCEEDIAILNEHFDIDKIYEKDGE